MTAKEKLRTATGKLAQAAEMLHDRVMDNHHEPSDARSNDAMPEAVNKHLDAIDERVKEIREIVK